MKDDVVPGEVHVSMKLWYSVTEWDMKDGLGTLDSLIRKVMKHPQRPAFVIARMDVCGNKGVLILTPTRVCWTYPQALQVSSIVQT